MSMLLAKPPAGGKLFIHHDQLAPTRHPNFDLSGSFAVVLVPQLNRRGAASSIWAVPKARISLHDTATWRAMKARECSSGDQSPAL
jgi:hypothetical protein